MGQAQQTQQLNANANDGAGDDDWEARFSKRYPDLSGSEVVEWREG